MGTSGKKLVADDTMRTRVRDHDWSATPLGPRERWPESLKLSVETMLAAGFPMSIRWGPEFITIYNDAYVEILGDKHPGALGLPAREVWPEIYEDLGRLNESILRGERDAFFAVDHPWKVQRHGRLIEHAYFTVSYSPIPNPAAPNGIGGVLVTVVETTDRVKNEESLRLLTDSLEAQVEQRKRERDRVWEVSEDLLGVSNFEGYFTSVNPAWTRLLGWTAAEIKTMRVSELRHPDDAAASETVRARLARGTPTERVENRFRHRDGSWRWIAWTMTSEDGLIYVIGRHITAEKEVTEALRDSERQFRSLVAGVVDYALIMLNKEGIVTSWNAGATRIKGYAEHEIVGQHFSRFYTPEDRAADAPAHALATATTTGRFEAESWRVRKDGSLFWAHVIIDAIYDSDGEVVGFAKVTRDITERREAQAALDQAHKQLAQAQKMEALGQLTGGVAHDFNNLLMIVSGHAQSLMRRLANPKDIRALEAVLVAAARGESLTRQLLAFSRRQPLNPTVISLGETVDAFRNVMAGSIREKVELVPDIAPDVWPVSVDISEFELALLNLVVNAQDAMPDGGTVTISARNVRLEAKDTPEQLAGEFVALCVSDTGSGIPADILPKVFEPFFTTKGVDKGTGLGLSQVYGFARQSGGTVAIAAELDRGTEVTIYLPRSRVPFTTPQRDEGRQETARTGEVVLLVEDNHEVRTVATALLEQLGYEVLALPSASDALAILGSGHHFDLLFTDVVLPGDVDGLALANEVRRSHPDLPILLTSGYAKVLNAEHGFPVLRKPYQIALLARAVRQTIDARRR
jgi:PAS domain S-box-containing protein